MEIENSRYYGRVDIISLVGPFWTLVSIEAPLQFWTPKRHKIHSKRNLKNYFSPPSENNSVMFIPVVRATKSETPQCYDV